MVLSLWVVAIQDAVVILTTFIIGRVGSCTEHAFNWSITWFSTIAGIMLPAAFYAGIGLVAISLRMPILLASSTLWYDSACVRRFKVNNPVLDGCQVVDILVIDCRFQINEEEIQRLFCLSVSDICYVSNLVP